MYLYHSNQETFTFSTDLLGLSWLPNSEYFCWLGSKWPAEEADWGSVSPFWNTRRQEMTCFFLDVQQVLLTLWHRMTPSYSMSTGMLIFILVIQTLSTSVNIAHPLEGLSMTGSIRREIFSKSLKRLSRHRIRLPA